MSGDLDEKLFLVFVALAGGISGFCFAEQAIDQFLSRDIRIHQRKSLSQGREEEVA